MQKIRICNFKTGHYNNLFYSENEEGEFFSMASSQIDFFYSQLRN